MMDSVTEVIDQYVRESAVDPDAEAHIINIGEITHIFSLGTDNSLYLTKENESGKQSKFDRYKLIENVKSFAAEKTGDRTVVIGMILENDVYISYTDKPEELKPEKLRRLDFNGVLGGAHLEPYRVLMTSVRNKVTMFIEFHDDAGFTQQFAAALNEIDDPNVVYYRLPSEFTEVVGTAPGRAARQFVDGVYTYGVFHAGNDSPYKGYEADAPQLIYTPCRTLFGRTPPAPIRLKTEVCLEAICTLKSPDGNKPETHLFAVGEGKLYFYPSQEQEDWIQADGKGVPRVIAKSDNILNAEQIAAYILADRLYIFIRTAGGELNYTVADYNDNSPGNFLEPVNLMNDAVRFDIHDGKIAVFTKNEFAECTHDPVTGAFKMDKVTVGTDLDTHICFSAYSTRINVNEPEAEVIIESKNGEKIGFYGNDYYYKTKKAVLKSDGLGYVKIVQKADGIAPDCYTVTCGTDTIEVNPAEQIHQKLLSMTSEDDFKNAVITDPFGNTSPLVPAEKQSSLAAAASGMASLHNAAIGLIPGFNNPITNFVNGVFMKITDEVISILPASLTDNPFTHFVADVVNDITAAFKWVANKIKYLYDKTVGKVINFVIQKTEKVWKFFIEIGGKVINVVLDCAEKVIEGIKNLLEMIGIPVDKIIGFFKKALGLDRAGKINSAIKNLTGISIDFLIEKASELKETSVEFLSNAVDTIKNWADIDMEKISGITLPDISGKHNNLLSDAGINLDSHNMYFFDLISNSVINDITMPKVKVTEGFEAAAEKLLEDIKDIGADIEKIPDSMLYVADEVEGLIKNFNLSNFAAVAKKILGVVAIDFMELSEAIIKTIFDIVIEGIRSVWQAVSSPITIPFLSGVLKIFGINEFSMADVVTYPTAFLASAVDSVGKLVSGKELFDTDAIDKLSKVKSIDEIKQIGGISYA